jgi:hypothetical protein
MPPSIETDTSSFLKTDVDVSVVRDIFLASLEKADGNMRRLGSLAPQIDDELEGLTLEPPRRLSQERVAYVYYNIEVAYKRDQGILVQDVLTKLLDFEQTLTEIPAWKELCATGDEVDHPLCGRGISLLSYKKPDQRYSEFREVHIIPEELVFNGRGKDKLPLELAMRMLQEHGLTSHVLPSDY